MNKFLRFSSIVTILLLSGSSSAVLFADETHPQHDTSSLEVDLSQANHLIKQRHYDDAIGILNGILNVYPQHARALKLRGNAFFEKQEYQLALQDFQNIATLFPSDAESYVDLAIIYYVLHDKEAALKNIDHALSINPKSPFAFKVRMIILK